MTTVTLELSQEVEKSQSFQGGSEEQRQKIEAKGSGGGVREMGGAYLEHPQLSVLQNLTFCGKDN